MEKTMTTTTYQTSLEEHHVSSDAHGPTVVITARIHGDEPAGEKACRSILSKFRQGTWSLKRGTVIIFPSLHPEAARIRKRGITADCNRGLNKDGVLYSQATPDFRDQLVRRFIYERVSGIPENVRLLSHHLARAYQESGFYFLDLHSTPENSPPHIIAEKWDRVNQSLAASTGIPLVLTNWRGACLNVTEREIAAAYPQQKILDHQTLKGLWATHNTALIHLAEASGYKGSICIEGGQNDDPRTKATHIAAIAGYLHGLGILDAPAHDIPDPATAPDVHRFQRLYTQTGDDTLIPTATAGQAFLRRQAGKVEYLGEAERLLHVFPDAPVGKPLAFTATKLSF